MVIAEGPKDIHLAWALLQVHSVTQVNQEGTNSQRAGGLGSAKADRKRRLRQRRELGGEEPTEALVSNRENSNYGK